MKKLLVFLLVLSLVGGAQSALAGKRKKKPKPYKSEQVTLAVPHPVAFSNTGSVNSITAKEFENTCALPSSNGLDAYVFEVPAAFKRFDARVEAIGEGGGPLGYDLDIYLYDASCQVTFPFNAAGTDETGLLPKGTAFILIHNYLGDPGLGAHIEISV